MKKFLAFLGLLSLAACSTNAVFTSTDISTSLSEHFLGSSPVCVHKQQPIIINADTTVTGEIDDSVSLYMYKKLEDMGCVKVLAVGSVRGNGGHKIETIHANLETRVRLLNAEHWMLFRGPKKRMIGGGSLDKADIAQLKIVADKIAQQDVPVSIVELGPMTISANLLKAGLVQPQKIKNIIGVGGRSPDETFSTGRGIPFTFRDMNVAEDAYAQDYIWRYHAHKLAMITYKTGLGERMITEAQISADLGSEIGGHARRRAQLLSKVGYQGKIPSWDTWTTAFFIRGGPERLGCKQTQAIMKTSASKMYRRTDRRQLQLLEQKVPMSRTIVACHQILQ